MIKLLATLLITILLATLICSVAQCAQGDIWLAGYLYITLKTPGNAKVFQQRVDTVQLRANDLLQLSATLPKITVKKAGVNYNICTDGKVFITVTPADAKAARTTSAKLSNQWAQRLRVVLPKATPIQH